MFRQTIADALAALDMRGEAYSRLLERAGFDLGLYRPGEIDDQTPHKRDELYIIATGTGLFSCAGKMERFSAGDAFFVTAGIEHRFEDYSEDFSTWVIFFGQRI